MTTLCERYIIHCPYVRARDYLEQMLEPLVAESRVQSLTLKAPVLCGRRELQTNVLVRYAKSADPMHFDQPWRVSWTPEHGGPYPDFYGELTVRADETYISAILELEGEYTPPLGLPGRVFDDAIGRTIATASAQALLAKLAVEMKAQYEYEEARKRYIPR